MLTKNATAQNLALHLGELSASETAPTIPGFLKVMGFFFFSFSGGFSEMGAGTAVAGASSGGAPALGAAAAGGVAGVEAGVAGVSLIPYYCTPLSRYEKAW